MMNPDAGVQVVTRARSEDAGLAVRTPAAPGLDPGPLEEPGLPDVADQHRALVESLVDVLDASPEQVEELLSHMHEELDGDRPRHEQVADAFERGLQLGLMVGIGSRELAGPPAQGGIEDSGPAGR